MYDKVSKGKFYWEHYPTQEITVESFSPKCCKAFFVKLREKAWLFKSNMKKTMREKRIKDQIKIMRLKK